MERFEKAVDFFGATAKVVRSTVLYGAILPVRTVQLILAGFTVVYYKQVYTTRTRCVHSFKINSCKNGFDENPRKNAVNPIYVLLRVPKSLLKEEQYRVYGPLFSPDYWNYLQPGFCCCTKLCCRRCTCKTLQPKELWPTC